MRTSNSIKNSITASIGYLISIVIGFISQTIFIKILGAEYLGLNGLFSNILTMLSIFELGIGSAIVFNLYKPIAENDKDKIKSLMLFYKKAYNIIGGLILTFGLSIIPFLTKIVGEVTVEVNIYIIYIMFLLNTVSSYLLVYKRNLLCANQKNYVVNIIHICYLIIVNITKLIILYITKNYYLYLIIMISGQILENVIITIIANKMYPYLKEKNVQPLDKEIEKDIFSKVKALLFHKVGCVIINGTDNIIISSFLGVISVGYYSNYCTIMNPIQNLFSQFISSTTSSVGNLLVENNPEKSYDVFKKIRFLNFWLACFSGICLLVIIQSFIKVWIGQEYLLNMLVVATLVFNYFQKIMRNTYMAFKDSAGIWKEDKYVPLIESLLNIVFSILLLKIFGLAGVFMGTIISGLALWCYSYPKYVYKKLFKRSYLNYAKETISYIMLFILLSIITYGISSLFVVSNVYLQLLTNIIISIIIPNVLLFILFNKTDNYVYFKNLIKKLFIKLKKTNLQKGVHK